MGEEAGGSTEVSKQRGHSEYDGPVFVAAGDVRDRM